MTEKQAPEAHEYFSTNDPREARKFFQKKMAFTTGPVELSSALKNNVGVVIVDVRQKEDFLKGHVPGAISLPKEKWPSLEGLKRDKLNVVYCYSHVCHLAARACIFFAESGFPVMELEGGFNAWKDNKLLVEGALETSAEDKTEEKKEEGPKTTWAA